MARVTFQSLHEPAQQPQSLGCSRMSASVRARPVGARLKRRAMVAAEGKTVSSGQVLHVRGSSWKPLAGTIAIFDLPVKIGPARAMEHFAHLSRRHRCRCASAKWSPKCKECIFHTHLDQLHPQGTATRLEVLHLVVPPRRVADEPRAEIGDFPLF